MNGIPASYEAARRVALQAGATAEVRFTRDHTGKMELAIDGQGVGTKNVFQSIRTDGAHGLKIGSSADGQRHQFLGSIADLRIANGVETASDVVQRVQTVNRIKQTYESRTGSNSENCKLKFQRSGDHFEFEYFAAGSTTPKFRSSDGITLGVMTNGQYLLADHDLPFSGPFGLTTFVVDFLLSPADLQVTDANNLRCGNFGGQLLAEIPDSHPCYLAKGAYLLPADTPLTRRIVGNANGNYDFHSVMPNGTSLVLEGIATQPGQEDTMLVNADASQVRFAPGVDKQFSLTISRRVGDEARAVAIQGIGGGPAAELDITVSPDLSVLRAGNRSTDKTVQVKAFSFNNGTGTVNRREQLNVDLPQDHDLVVTVSDWGTVDLQVDALSFE